MRAAKNNREWIAAIGLNCIITSNLMVLIPYVYKMRLISVGISGLKS